MRLSLFFLFGGDSGGETPVPIPNTEVKPSSADGTSLVTRWESRTLPKFFKALLRINEEGPFFWQEGTRLKRQGNLSRDSALAEPAKQIPVIPPPKKINLVSRKT